VREEGLMVRDFINGFATLAGALVFFSVLAASIVGLWAGLAALPFLRNAQVMADIALIIVVTSVLAGLIWAACGWVIRETSN
jgi:hypothetical protein